MPARSNEVMLVPVYADATVVQSFVASVERHVLTDAILVICNELLHAAKRRLFFDGEHEDQVGLCLDSSFIERADRSQDRFYVASVVSDSRGENFAVANLSLDLQAFLKDGVEVSVNHQGFRRAGSLLHRDEVSF